MIHTFTLALYDPSKGKHDQQSWDCNHTNAQLIYDIAENVMKKKLLKFPNSKMVIVNIDSEIEFISVKV